MVKVKGKLIEGCIECYNENGFILPEDIIQATINGDLVFFLWCGYKYRVKKSYAYFILYGYKK